MKENHPYIGIDRKVIFWLYSGIVFISLMVIVGGLTRLTQSGLSIVEWKPIVGMIPPLLEIEWQNEFDLYKQTPEFKLTNVDFTLKEYKSIYFWEYVHRLIGRIIGIVFLLPGVYFWLNDKFDRRTKIKLIIILIGGLIQGFLGWYMVKSGLVKNPYVSHYRLATHLIAALLLIGFIYWTILDYKYRSQVAKRKIVSNFNLFGLLILVFIQILYGAFVAGLKAGKVYNYFPKMGEDWLPLEFYPSFEKQGVQALFESQSVVQFAHRVMGVIIFMIVLVLLGKVKKLPLENRIIFCTVSTLIIIQVILGVLTLILSVPILLGLIHQSMVIFILIAIIYAIYQNNYLISNK